MFDVQPIDDTNIAPLLGHGLFDCQHAIVSGAKAVGVRQPPARQTLDGGQWRRPSHFLTLQVESRHQTQRPLSAVDAEDEIVKNHKSSPVKTRARHSCG